MPTMDNNTFDQWIKTVSQYPGLFMTGTDTDVGKTWVGVKIINALMKEGVNVGARKPVESGWPDDALIENTDAAKLGASSNTPLNQVCTLRFKAPLSPPRAALLEGQEICIGMLVSLCRQHLQTDDFLYVEGAGGFYSPLATDGLNADLAAALDLPIVLVTEDRVGCINHVLLTIEAIKQRQLTLAGVILNPIRESPQTMDNLSDLQALLEVPVLRWQQ